MVRPRCAWCGALVALTLPLSLAACGDDGGGGDGGQTATPRSDRHLNERPASAHARAELRDAGGTVVGHVQFEDVARGDDAAQVTVEVDGLDTTAGFHGLHVHANDDPANGEGCTADPAAAPDTWFAAVDGHLRAGDQEHGDHRGDLPSLLVNGADGSDGDGDGAARMSFVTDRFTAADVTGAAVVVHAGPDNFGNVPTGSGAEQYTPNTPAALQATATTGNSGPRIACGLIEG